MSDIFLYIVIVGFLIFSILSIYRSVDYGSRYHSFWKWLFAFFALAIIAFGIFFTLCGGGVVVYGILSSGENALFPYYFILATSLYIYWYGILQFQSRRTNRILSTGGFIVSHAAAIKLFWLLDWHFLIYAIPVWAVMIYFLVETWIGSRIQEESPKD